MPTYPTRKNWKKPDPRVAYGRGQAYRQPAPAPAAPVAPAAPAAKAPLKIDGDGKLWVTLQKVTDPESGWVKTTRAAAMPGGVLINTCSRKLGSAIVAEALCYVPQVRLERDATTKEWRLA